MAWDVFGAKGRAEIGTEVAQKHFSALCDGPATEALAYTRRCLWYWWYSLLLQAYRLIFADSVLLYRLIPTFSDSFSGNLQPGKLKKRKKANCINPVAIKLKDGGISLQQHIHVLIKSNSAFLGHVNCCSKEKRLQINIKQNTALQNPIYNFQSTFPQSCRKVILSTSVGQQLQRTRCRPVRVWSCKIHPIWKKNPYVHMDKKWR